MNPGLRLSAALMLSLVLWSPTALVALRGDIDLAAAGLRYLLAFVVARVAVGVLSAVVGAYTRDEEEPEPEMGEPTTLIDDAEPPPLRRRNDPQPVSPDPPVEAPEPPPTESEAQQADRPS